MCSIIPRYLLFFIYGIANLYAIVYALCNKSLLGGISNELITNNFEVLFVGLTLVATFFVFQFILFPFFDKVKVSFRLSKRIFYDLSVQKIVGIFLLVAQFIYLFFAIIFGVGVAGATVESRIPFVEIWIFIQIDFLFLIYYGFFRESKLFYINFFVFLVSNVLRGWTSVFLIAAFLELCRLWRSGKIKKKYVLLFLCIGILVYPLILFLKFYVRSAGSGREFLDIGSAIGVIFGVEDFLGLFVFAVNQLAERFQQFSITYGIYHFREVLGLQYASGDIVQFWLEGFHGNALYRLFGNPLPPNLGVAATNVIPYSFQFIEGSFNVSPSLLGWIFVLSPNYLGFLVYIIFLSFFSIIIPKIINAPPLVGDLVWLMWLLLLLHGWLQSFVAFIYAFFVFILICSTSWIFKNLLKSFSQ